MTRHAVAVAVAVLLTPSSLIAQPATQPPSQFTVTVASAAVHKAPSTGSPVVGRAARGMVIDVTRDVGSWVKVAWPEAEDGIGYVHQSMGKLAQRQPREERLASALAPSSTAASAPAPAQQLTPAPVPLQSPTSMPMTYVAPPTHNVGFGARIGAMREFGVTTRLWSFGQFGVQVQAMRWTETHDETPGRVTSVEFAPGGIYMFGDYVNGSAWLRPYVGGALAIRRATFRLVQDDPSSITDSSVGYRAFGGTEITFPSVPRIAFSLDVGYLHADAPFPGFDDGGMRVSISGHWYVK